MDEEAADLLQETLDEEGAADKKLTKLAETIIVEANAAASKYNTTTFRVTLTNRSRIMADTSSSSRDKGGHLGTGEARPAAAAVPDKARDQALSLAAKAKEAGSSAVEKTKDAASSFIEKVEDMASTIGHQAEGAVGATGGAMKSLAGTIRDQGPGSGMLHNVASGVASGLESGGAYLQDHNLHGMAKDVTDLVRRYPLQAILVGVGVGFCVGRLSRS